MATIAVHREVECDPQLAVERIYQALGADEIRETTRTFIVPFEDLGLPDVGMLAREAVVTVREPEAKAFFTRIHVSWRAGDSASFPVFRGYFEVQPLTNQRVDLQLIGYYYPPFGMAGAFFEKLLGHRIADATVRHLMDEIVGTMEEGAASRVV